VSSASALRYHVGFEEGGAVRIALATGWLYLALLPTSGCAAPLEAPSAYRDERYLCGQEHAAAFDVWANTCREDYLAGGSCVGVASMKGESAGEPFVIDSTLDRSYVPENMHPTVLELLSPAGTSPYFTFRISVTNLRLETTAESSGACRSDLSLFNMEARGGSINLVMKIETCEIEQRSGGLDVAFSASFVRGGFIDACMFLLPQTPRREIAEGTLP
jgi:hypothetical protein